MKGIVGVMSEPEPLPLGGFFDYIFGTETGYVYVARKQPLQKAGNLTDAKPMWLQQFYQWPQQRVELIQHVLDSRSEWEVYYGPALYREPSAGKESVKGANVFWVEFDGEVPTDVLGLPEPTLRVQSSDEGHEHWYWRLDEFTAPEALERVNRSLTYLYGADSSGWDATQVLRPPETFNHKRERQVTLLDRVDVELPVGLFDGLPEPPPPMELPVPDRIPAVEDVVFKYKFPTGVVNLFRHGVPVGQRSSGLMSLGYSLAEMNLSNEEVLSVLMNADQRWGKFAQRPDRVKRLLEIVTIARQKYPLKTGDGTDLPTKLQPMGLKTLLATEINLEWVWEGWLQRNGYLLLTGPSGIGKTQFALDAAAHIALGKQYLDRPVTRSRIGFFSLEMGLADLKEFVKLTAMGFSPEEKDELEEQLLFFPLGEPLYMNDKGTRDMIEQVISDYQLDGIIVDSLGSATEESVADEQIKKLFHWNDRLRQRLNCFSWFVHHHRKASGENKRPNKLSDVFGSQYITSYATTVLCLWDSSLANAIQMLPLKVRLSKKPAEFHLHRDANLHFTRLVTGVVKPPPDKPDTETQQVASAEGGISLDMGAM